MLRIGVSGASGRMGTEVCKAVNEANDMEVVGTADPEDGTTLESILSDVEIVVDFTVPDSVFENTKLCLEKGVHAVVGTTGMDEAQIEKLSSVASSAEANCLLAPNFAIGAVLMMEASKMIAPHMPDCEIIELHHEQKIDAPSGTAKRTADLISESGGQMDVPIHSVRLPGLVAHQEVLFGSAGQTLSVRHDSMSRESFMPGVLLAIRRVSTLNGLVVGLENLL